MRVLKESLVLARRRKELRTEPRFFNMDFILILCEGLLSGPATTRSLSLTISMTMADAWIWTDIGIASVVQIIRCGAAQLPFNLPTAVCCFSLAVIEGTILANSLDEQGRLTPYIALTILIRIFLDALLGFNLRNAATGAIGSVIGLFLGPVLHNQATGPLKSASEPIKKDHEQFLETQSISDDTTVRPKSQQQHLRPVTHTVVDIDNETSQPIVFTPDIPTRKLDYHAPTETPTRVDTDNDLDDFYNIRSPSLSIFSRSIKRVLLLRSSFFATALRFRTVSLKAFDLVATAGNDTAS